MMVVVVVVHVFHGIVKSNRRCALPSAIIFMTGVMIINNFSSFRVSAAREMARDVYGKFMGDCRFLHVLWVQKHNTQFFRLICM